MRKLASIQKILSINPIPDADLIEVAQVLGWKVVVKKGEFNVGDNCVYCEIDSLMPEHPEFEFLRKSKFRIRTIKLKNQISQGICFPLSILSFFGKTTTNQFTGVELFIPDNDLENPIPIIEDNDLTSALGIEKYEPPIPAELEGEAKGGFPSFMIKTDEDRIQILPHILEQYAGEKFIATEKLDGCLDGNSLIETEDGIKTIKEICETKYFGKIKTFDFINNKIIYENIINHFIRENNKLIKTRLTDDKSPKKWFKITLENEMEIILTENHEIWLPELSCWRRVGELIGNEKFLINI